MLPDATPWRHRLRRVPRSDTQRLATEWVILRVRYGAAAIAVLISWLVRDTTRSQLWVSALVLLITAVLIHLALRRNPTGRQLTSIGAAAFAADTVATLLTLAIVREDPADPVTMVALILAIEAALRWQVLGALLAGLAAATATAVWTQLAHLAATDADAPLEYAAFRATATLLIALMVGTMVRALEAARERAQTVLELSPEVILTLSPSGEIMAANPATEPVLGHAPDTLLGRRWQDLLSAGERVELPATPTTGLTTRALRHASGQPVWLECSVRHQTRTAVTTVIARDITARLASQRQRDESEQRFRALFDHHLDAVFGLDVQGRISDANPACTRLLGQPVQQLIGTPADRFIAPEARPRAKAALARSLAGQAADVEVVLELTDGGQRHAELTLLPIVIDGVTTGVFGLVEDITERVRREAELAFRAGHDALTGLPNRATLLSHLAGRLAGTGATAALFVDLDGFKSVNDTHGHAAGDAVLVAVAHRLRGMVRAEDLVARLAGDEFCVVLHPTDELAAHRIADRANATLREPVLVPGATLRVGASVGLALAQPGESATALLARADAAMYAIKARAQRTTGPDADGERRRR